MRTRTRWLNPGVYERLSRGSQHNGGMELPHLDDHPHGTCLADGQAQMNGGIVDETPRGGSYSHAAVVYCTP